MTNQENVKVVVRCRPLSPKETERGFKSVINVFPEQALIELIPKDGNSKTRTFFYNSVYGQNSTQRFIYDDTARPIVSAFLEGYNGTIFAYGQTGTGKTFTMEGEPEKEEQKGIILHSFDQVFAHIQSTKDRTFLVRASYLQIYKENLYDLLGDPAVKLKVRQVDDSVTVLGLSSHIVKSPKEITDLLMKGKENRVTGETLMNKHSSRSHSVFTVIVEQANETIGCRVGKLHLVDLAGSERLEKTGTDKKGQMEGILINQSLSCLGNVINALVTGQKHIPYRESKLTSILKDSLGGNSKTAMVANIGPAIYNFDETLSTLLYAQRARSIKNRPEVNIASEDAVLIQLREKI